MEDQDQEKYNVYVYDRESRLLTTYNDCLITPAISSECLWIYRVGDVTTVHTLATIGGWQSEPK